MRQMQSAFANLQKMMATPSAVSRGSYIELGVLLGSFKGCSRRFRGGGSVFRSGLSDLVLVSSRLGLRVLGHARRLGC